MNPELRRDNPARVRSDGLLRFFLLAYALMWTCFFIVAFTGISARGLLGSILLLTGAFAPGLSATCLTARADGKTGVKALLGPVLQWRVSAKFYSFALVYMVAIKLGAAAIHRLGTGAWPRFGETPLYLIPVAIAFSTPFQAGEEVGWRGYALPRLSDHLGLRRASIYLGVIWAVWHLPQFFIRASDTYGQSFLIFAVQVVAISVTLAWLWNAASKSLLLPMLLHSAVNNSKDIVPSATPGLNNAFGLSASPVAWVTVLLLWVVALYLLTRMPGLEALRLGKNGRNS